MRVGFIPSPLNVSRERLLRWWEVTHYVENNNIHDVQIHKFTNVFGPTCDSGDKIDECFLPNNIQVGDWIILPNMGAYTNAGMIEFNGIKGASSFEAQCSNDIEQ